MGPARRGNSATIHHGHIRLPDDADRRRPGGRRNGWAAGDFARRRSRRSGRAFLADGGDERVGRTLWRVPIRRFGQGRPLHLPDPRRRPASYIQCMDGRLLPRPRPGPATPGEEQIRRCSQPLLPPADVRAQCAGNRAVGRLPRHPAGSAAARGRILRGGEQFVSRRPARSRGDPRAQRRRRARQGDSRGMAMRSGAGDGCQESARRPGSHRPG